MNMHYPNLRGRNVRPRRARRRLPRRDRLETEPLLAVRDVLERAVARSVGSPGTPARAGELVPLHVSDELTVLKVVWAPGMRARPARPSHVGGDRRLLRRRGQQVLPPRRPTTSSSRGRRPLATGDVACSATTRSTRSPTRRRAHAGRSTCTAATSSPRRAASGVGSRRPRSRSTSIAPLGVVRRGQRGARVRDLASGHGIRGGARRDRRARRKPCTASGTRCTSRRWGGTRARADHVGRRLVEPDDEQSWIFYARDDDGEVVGTARLSWGGNGFTERQIEEYGLGAVPRRAAARARRAG